MNKYVKGSIAARIDADLRREQSIKRDAELKKQKAKQHVCHLCGGVALNEDYKLRPGVFICASCYDRIFVQKRGVFGDQNEISNDHK